MENGVVKRQGMDLTQGNTAWSLVMFSLPMIAGNFLQQLYNVADTIILGQLAGSTALAAAGSSFSLMNFVTSIFLGLCLGTGVQLSMDHARRDPARLKTDLWHSFVVTALPALAIWLGMTLFRDTILLLLQIPAEVVPDMRAYLGWITAGIPAVYLFNFFGGFFRAVGDSRTPAVWLIVTCILNIVLDFWWISLWKTAGAALATMTAQWISAVGITGMFWHRYSSQCAGLRDFRWDAQTAKRVTSLALMTSLQQSVMNFGILLVQGKVNTFGPQVMAGFAAGVKIDSFAYMPAQEFGNAASTFIAQNHGAGKAQRVKSGIRTAVVISCGFCLCVSLLVLLFRRWLLACFIPQDPGALEVGSRYLVVEGSFYFAIGILFLLYGFFRAFGNTRISLLLTLVSLGTRVLLSWTLPDAGFGLEAIWWSVPIGWLLADVLGIWLLIRREQSRARRSRISRKRCKAVSD